MISGEIRITMTTGNETLMEVARREGFGDEIVANSNRSVDPWGPHSGTEIILLGKVIVPYAARAGAGFIERYCRGFEYLDLPKCEILADPANQECLVNLDRAFI